MRLAIKTVLGNWNKIYGPIVCLTIELAKKENRKKVYKQDQKLGTKTVSTLVIMVIL